MVQCNFISFTHKDFKPKVIMNKIFSCLIISFFIFQSCTNSGSNIVEAFFTELQTGTDASLRGLHVVDENVIWASGSEGTVLLSTNAGKSWEVVFQDTTLGLFFNSLKFADDKNGLAVSDPIDGKFFILRTENAGENWERVTDLPDVLEGEANFAASNTCIEFLPSGKAWIASGGEAARVFYSNDFGKSWDVAKTPMIRGLASSGIFSISFINEKVGVIVGGIYDQPELNTNVAAYSFDGGLTWLPAVTMPEEYRSCVREVKTSDNSFLFAIGKTGCDYSMDKGMNWQFLNETGFYTFRSVPGKMDGFAAGANGKVAKVTFNQK